MDFVKIPKKRMTLTQEDFTTLVSGNILVKDGVEIILQDIGFSRMRDITISQNNTLMTTEELVRHLVEEYPF